MTRHSAEEVAEVLAGLADGLENQDVARRLGVSLRTVSRRVQQGLIDAEAATVAQWTYRAGLAAGAERERARIAAVLLGWLACTRCGRRVLSDPATPPQPGQMVLCVPCVRHLEAWGALEARSATGRLDLYSLVGS